MRSSSQQNGVGKGIFVVLLLALCAMCGSATSLPNAQAPTLRTARGHAMQYYISLPRGWTKDRKWPVVFTIDGGNKAWLDNAQAFAHARDEKNLPFIIVTPLVLTNGGGDLQNLRHLPQYNYPVAVWDDVERNGRCAFDIEGLEAVMRDVQAEYSGDAKFFITGWSAGGHLTWAMIFRYPERLRGAVLTGANFGRCFTKEIETPDVFSTAPERTELPVKILDGEHDPQIADLERQNLTLLRSAQDHGYRQISRYVVPREGHSPMADAVLSYFYSLLQR